MTNKKPNDEKKAISSEKKDSFEYEIKKLKQKIKNLKEELKDKNEKLIRSYADLQNYQKRMEKELKSKEEEIKKKYILELIDINELLKNAYEDKNPKEGLKLILNNIDNFFLIEDIKYINCLGKQFDHNYHHAITTIEKDNCKDDTIVEEVKKGYLMDNKLLRPSQVIVAKKK